MAVSGPAKPPATAPAPASQVPTKLTTANVGQFLFSEGVKEQIALALPGHLKPERMIRMALTTVRRTPKLLECDALTLVACIVQASELGLELSGPLGQAYMIPRKNHGRMEACFQIGYRGFLRLAYNTGQVAFFNARAVHQGDRFEYSLGTDQFIKHQPGGGKAAKITHFYGVLRQKDGSADCDVWTIGDMEYHRDRFRSDAFLKNKDKNYRGPWDTDFEAMGCKTMIRELAKRAPLSAELMSLASRDEYEEAGFRPANPAIDFRPADVSQDSGPGGESAHPDTLESIDAELQRVGFTGMAADGFLKDYRAETGELLEAGALAALKELSGIEDAGN
jgi:recombination protein RecT